MGEQAPQDLEEIAFVAALRAERRENLAAGRLVARACADGDVDLFRQAAESLAWTTDGWRAALRTIGAMPSVPPEIREAFRLVWIETKMLPLKVGHRPTLAAALRILMAGSYEGEPLRLYRGTRAGERRRRLYGFSWTTDRAIAENFAQHWRNGWDGAVLLETVAPAPAVLWAREVDGFYDEGEVVVDPYALGRVALIERWPGTPCDDAGRPLALHGALGRCAAQGYEASKG